MFLRGLIVAFLLGVLAFGASAHRVGVPLSTIEWNANTQSWEVVHKLSLHDVEKKVHALGKSSDFLSTEAGRAWLRDFVDQRFVVSGGQTAPNFVGIEYDHDVVWIYYELKPADSALKIVSNLRFDSEAKLYNLLNITREENVESYIFREGNRAIVTNLGAP